MLVLLIVILGLVINGVIAHIIGNVGKDKKIGYSTTFWISFLLSPIIGLLLVIASLPIDKVIHTEKEEDIIYTEEELNEIEIKEKAKRDKLDKIINNAILIVSIFLISILFFYSL
jgi:MFS family permease